MERPKKYKTEEEKKEYYKKYYQEHREEMLERQRQYYQEHKEKHAELVKKYRQEHKEELTEYNKQYGKQWRKEHPEYMKRYNKRHYKNNREKEIERVKQWKQTPFGRASYLLSGYQQSDKKYKRGKCTLTAEWIVENIFTQKCHWCPETDWTKIGCDRIDNSLPHTPDNVIPCCAECNNKRGTKTYEEFKDFLKRGG